MRCAAGARRVKEGSAPELGLAWISIALLNVRADSLRRGPSRAWCLFNTSLFRLATKIRGALSQYQLGASGLRVLHRMALVVPTRTMQMPLKIQLGGMSDHKPPTKLPRILPKATLANQTAIMRPRF